MKKDEFVWKAKSLAYDVIAAQGSVANVLVDEGDALLKSRDLLEAAKEFLGDIAGDDKELKAMLEAGALSLEGFIQQGMLRCFYFESADRANYIDRLIEAWYEIRESVKGQ